MVLKLEDCIFERDEEGKLIPREKELVEKVDGKVETILCIPLTRGERKKLFAKTDVSGNTDIDTDKELVLNNCISPKFDEKTIEDTEFGLIENIALTILLASGMDIKKNTPKEANKKVETDFPVGSQE